MSESEPAISKTGPVIRESEPTSAIRESEPTSTIRESEPTSTLRESEPDSREFYEHEIYQILLMNL